MAPQYDHHVLLVTLAPRTAVNPSEMEKRMVTIGIAPTVKKEELIHYAGIILGIHPKKNMAYIIADARGFEEKIRTHEIRVKFPNGEIIHPLFHDFYIEDGILGIFCHFQKPIDTNLIKTMEICKQPLQNSDVVHVYEGVYKFLTGGYVTLFHGNHFSHDCAVAYLSEYGAPVVNSSGQMVGMCYSLEYHLRAKGVFALLGTIMSIKRTLMQSSWNT